MRPRPLGSRQREGRPPRWFALALPTVGPSRAHARSGDPIAIAAYLGTSDKFDRSIADFGPRYADQNDRDFARFTAAISSGELEALEGV